MSIKLMRIINSNNLNYWLSYDFETLGEGKMQL